MRRRKQNDIIIALNKILSDGFCQHTHHRAYKTLEGVSAFITTEEYQTIKNHLIWTDCDNPDVWGGWRGITDHVKYEYKLFSEYIKSLIKKYE